MFAILLSLYLKFNVLLAVAWVLWWSIKRAALWIGFDVNYSRQLTLARMLFAGSLLVLPLVALLDALLPTWSGGVSGIVETREFVTTAVASGVQRGNVTDAISLVITLGIIASFVLQGQRLAQQVRQLRRIIDDATPLRKIHGLQLLVSSAITSPFSTRVLGNRQIVLPAELLSSPRNLHLAVKHELQHVRNHDLDWVIALEAIRALCNWNPVTWLWHNEFDCLQEFACDEVLVNERHVNREGYGNCLLEVAGTANGIALFAASNMVPRFSLWQNNQQQLKRRILMLMNNGKRNSGMKSLCYGVLIAAGLLVEAGVVTGAEPQSNDVVPVDRTTAPQYPEAALADKKEGWVQMQFAIDAAGNVLNPKVVDHCVRAQGADPETCEKADLFDAPALAALSKWKYSTGAAKEGVQTIIRFQLNK